MPESGRSIDASDGEPTDPDSGEPSDNGARYLWPVLVTFAVLAANFPALVGITDVNPLVTYAGLTWSRGASLLPGTSTLDINVAATSQALGHRAALDWLHWHVPWWNPYEGLGTPLAAGMQAAVFFPLTILLVWSGGQLALRIILEAATGLCTYFLLRRLGTRDAVACTGGIVFALDGTFAWFQHAAINPVALLPAAILGVEIARERGLGDWRTLLLPLALALSVTAGFPETAFFDDGLVVAWALWRVVSLPTWEDRGRLAGRLSLLGGGGVLITAPLILAFRAYLTEASVGAHNGMSHVHLPVSNLLTLIDPYITGPLKAFVPRGSAAIENLFITNSGYVLVSGLVLALAGLALSKRETGIRVLLGLWVIVISLRDFGFLPVQHLFSHVPYVNESAVFRSAVPSVELAMVLLAALGIEAVLDTSRSRSRARRWHVPVLAVGTGLLLLGLAAGPSRKVLHLVMSGGPYATSPRPYVFGALVGTVVILVSLAVAGALRGRIAAVGLCGVLLFEAFGSFVYPELAATRSPAVDMKPVIWLRAHLGEARFYSLNSDPAVGPEYGGPIAPNYGSYFGLASADYLDIPDPLLYVNYVHDHLDAGAGSEFFGTIFGRHAGSPSGLVELGKNVAAFESIGVRYIVAGAAIELASYVPSATRVYDDGLVAIWELPRPTSYYSTLEGSCRLTPDGFNEVVANCQGRAVVQREELGLAGWSVSVNGRGAALLPSHGSLFTSVTVGRGTSTVVWTYRPGHLRTGEVLALFGLILLVAPFGWLVVRRGRRRT
ncbi:MAG: hypothetical protein ACLPQS_15070 [Acidimicrobiales bacterium]